jgi:hypothetical protein
MNNKKEKLEFKYVFDNPKNLDEYIKDLEERDQPDACDIDDDECESCGC